MAQFTYTFDGADTADGTGVPTPNGYPTLTVMSGSWRRYNNRAYTSTTASSNPILYITEGDGSMDQSLDVSSGGGDALYARVTDINNWIRLKVRNYTSSYYTEPTWDGTYTVGSWQYVRTESYAYQPGDDAYAPGSHYYDYVGGYATQWVQTDANHYGTIYSRTVTPNYVGGGWTYYTNYQLVLEKRVAGTITQLGSYGTGSISKIRLRTVGTSVQAWYNNVSTPVISVNVSDFVTVNKHGIGRGSSDNLNHYGLDNWYVDSLNTAPNAPTGLSPSGGVSINRSNTNRFTWAFSDPDTGDTQSKFDLQYRIVGAGSWTTVTTTTPNQFHDFAGGTFAAGNYEWQVRTYDSSGTQGAWTTSSFFTAADAPSGPTITSPTNGGTITGATHTVTWSAAAQTDYQVLVTDASDVTIHDSGEITNAAARSYVAPFPTNGVSRKVKVRVKASGLWSSYTSVSVTVSYTPPAVPTVTAQFTDLQGLGSNHAVQITPTHPTPQGSEPTVAHQDVYVRETLEGGDGIRIVAEGPLTTMWYYAPTPGVAYEVRIRANGTNGSSTYSEWTAVAGDSALKGFLLHDPRDPEGSLVHVRLNDRGATDRLELEAVTQQYQGRVYPVVEYGDAEVRTIEVPLFNSEQADGTSAAVRRLLLRRTPLCYRDSKGRKVYAAMKEHEESDTFWGYRSSVSLLVVDVNEEV